MNNQDEFQLLVSPEDYSLLEKKNHALTAELQKLKQDLSTLQNTLIGAREQICQLQQRNKQMEKEKNYLSINGLKWARKLLDIEVDNENLKVSCTEKELYFAQQFKESLTNNKKIEENYNLTLKELSKAKLDFNTINDRLMGIINKPRRDLALQTENAAVKGALVGTQLTSLDISNLQNRLRSLQNQLHSEIQKNQQLIFKSTKEASTLEQSIVNLEQQNLSYQQTTKDLFKKLQETTQALQKQKNRNEKLQVSLIQLKNKKWDAEAYLKEKQRELMEKIKVEREKLKQEGNYEIQGLKKSHNEEMERLKSELRVKVQKYEKQSMQLIEEKAELIKLLQSSQQKIEEANVGIQNYKSANARLNEEVVSLKNKYEKEVRDLKQEGSRMREEQEQSRAQFEETIDKASKQREQLLTSMNKSESALLQLKKQNEAITLKLSTLLKDPSNQSQLQKLTQENQKLRINLRNLKENEDILSKEYEDIIQQLQDNQKHLKNTLLKYQDQFQQRYANSQIEIETAQRVVKAFMETSCSTLRNIGEVSDFSEKDAETILNEQKKILLGIMDEKILEFMSKKFNKVKREQKKEGGRKKMGQKKE